MSGHTLKVWFGEPIVSSGNQQFIVDNVRVTETPEPSTMVLLATGLLGLLCYAWRRRR